MTPINGATLSLAAVHDARAVAESLGAAPLITELDAFTAATPD